jgi:HD-GYP domain-containing protein (c-di-GMP phosphodiesterase class II)
MTLDPEKNMTQTEILAQPLKHEHQLARQARALAVVLREEFDTPFAFYNAATGETLDSSGPGCAIYLAPAEVLEVAADGRARVTRLADGSYSLQMVLPHAGQPALVGAGRISLLGPGGPGAAQAQVWLQKWLQAVSDRLRLADQAPLRRRPEEELASGAPWEVVLTLDHLIRHLRIHKDPGKNLNRILEAAFGLLSVESLHWVPQNSDAPVLTQGEARLAPPDCRQLATFLTRSEDAHESGLLLCNQVRSLSWAERYPHLINLLAFRIGDSKAPGWVIAINKTGGRGSKPGVSPDSCSTPPDSRDFRRSDVTVLAPFASLLELYVRGSGRYQELKDLLVGLTGSLTAALDAKDSYTYGHSERVARIAVELGRELGLGEEELGDIYLAGLLHDVGKIGIQDSILCKKGPLTPEEYEHVKQHVTIGYTILSDLRQIRSLLPGVLYHHERYDGKGYPDGLAGEAIPLLARILAVADSYDAMCTPRPYREAMPTRRVEEILVQGSGTQWDPHVIEAFLRCRSKIHAIRQRGVGDSLRLAIDNALRSVAPPDKGGAPRE